MKIKNDIFFVFANKIRRALLLFFLFFLYLSSYEQSYIGAGYFNGHVFATYGPIGTLSAGSPKTLSGSLGTNAFTVTFNDVNLYSFLNTNNASIDGPYTVGALPANSNWPSNVSVIDMGYENANAPGSNYTTIAFTTPLDTLDQMHLIDFDLNEAGVFEFLNASGTLLPIAGNIKAVRLSNIAVPSGTISYPTATSIRLTGNAGNSANSCWSLVALSSSIKTIRFKQTAGAAGGKDHSYDITFSKGTRDYGDAPSSYGIASHLSLAALLKAGTLGPDDETAQAYSANANGDDAAVDGTVFDDEDGVSSLSTLMNNGTSNQLIASYSVNVTITNSTGSTANVIAWADWNNNKVFDAGEGSIATTVPTGSTNVSRTISWNNFTLNGTSGQIGTYLRIRVSTDAITTASSTGFAADGETEDYFIPFAVVVPVKLINFQAEKKAEAVKLYWQTASEDNSKFFIIEYSTDGNNYTTIGELPAAGNSNSISSYQWLHSFPVTGNNYYRLRMTDIDGQYKYSSVVTIHITTDNRGATITIYPNPTSSTARIVLATKAPENTKLKLYTVNGQQLKRMDVSYLQTIPLNAADLIPGLYYVVLEQNGSVINKLRFVKTK